MYRKTILQVSIIAILVVGLGCITGCGTYTEEDAEKLARDVIEDSATYRYDGIQETLKLKSKERLEEQHTWRFIFEFESRHAGYGDRTDQMVAQVITPHQAVITVKENKVEKAVLDEKWDILTQSMVDIDV